MTNESDAMTEEHEPTNMYRRFERSDGTETLELDLDYTVVLRREDGGEWQSEEYDWHGEAEQVYGAAVAAALTDGWLEDESATTSLTDALTQAFGELPKAYATFLDKGRHKADGGFHIQGVPGFPEDAVLLVELDGVGIAQMYFCGQDPDRHYAPISKELHDADNPWGDPHSLFFAVDRRDPKGPVVLVSAGEITPAFDTFRAFEKALKRLG